MKRPLIKRLSILKKRTNGLSASEKRGMHIYILPNLFTTGNMFFGFFSMVQSLQGNFIIAAYCIVAAAVFDLLDGRVARMTQATSKFGMEYDSLSDLVSFGVAPAILLYLWALKPFDRIGWLASFMFMACGALRLARFNVQAASIEKRYFQGLPIPMAAGIVATSVTAATAAGVDPHRNVFILLMTFLLGFVMVSTFRYRSFKELDFKQRKPFFTLIIGLCIFIFIAMKPEVHLFIAFITYAVLGAVLGILSPARKKLTQVIIAESARRHENQHEHDTPPENRPPS
jgi:CDP-diacylglycerol--serine O-phosphatidyltransferase